MGMQYRDAYAWNFRDEMCKRTLTSLNSGGASIAMLLHPCRRTMIGCQDRQHHYKSAYESTQTYTFILRRAIPYCNEHPQTTHLLKVPFSTTGIAGRRGFGYN